MQWFRSPKAIGTLLNNPVYFTEYNPLGIFVFAYGGAPEEKIV